MAKINPNKILEPDRFRTSQVQAQRKASFCSQKEAKKLFDSGPMPFQRHRLKRAKVFCAAFFQKSGYFLVPT
jgi:hypothetical protein